MADRSRLSTVAFRSRGGTAPCVTASASPSAIAVLPTPGSPTRQALFFRRRTSTAVSRRSSSLRPMTGSISPASARSFRLTQNSSRMLPSPLAPVDLPPAATSSGADFAASFRPSTRASASMPRLISTANAELSGEHARAPTSRSSEPMPARPSFSASFMLQSKAFLAVPVKGSVSPPFFPSLGLSLPPNRPPRPPPFPPPDGSRLPLPGSATTAARTGSTLSPLLRSTLSAVSG
mmetsp:Transcript_43827/g.137689  ORF Transcript_43827/g.137689 Transcript_43827/m.137689 type:complete len:235 (+) Transcript_43827:1499-2203(+)